MCHLYNFLHLLPSTESFNNFCRNTAYEAVAGERFSYDRSSRDGYIIAKRHASEYYGTGSYPTVVADGDWLCIGFTEIGFWIGVEVRIASAVPFNRVLRSIYLPTRCGKDIVAYGDGVAVNESATIVDRHVVT